MVHTHGEYPSEKWNVMVADAHRLKDELRRLVQKRVIWKAHNESLRGRAVNDSTSYVHHWMRENYVDSMIVGLRRILDRTQGTLSLAKLLGRIYLEYREFTFERFCSLYGSAPDGYQIDLATADFSHYSKDGKSIDRGLIQADISRLAVDSGRVLDFANSRITHWFPDRPQQKDLELTYDELHKAFDDVAEVMNKYLVLLTASQAEYEPALQFGYEKAFERMVADAKYEVSAPHT